MFWLRLSCSTTQLGFIPFYKDLIDMIKPTVLTRIIRRVHVQDISMNVSCKSICILLIYFTPETHWASISLIINFFGFISFLMYASKWPNVLAILSILYIRDAKRMQYSFSVNVGFMSSITFLIWPINFAEFSSKYFPP